MMATQVLAFVAGVSALILAGAGLARRPPTAAAWLFAAGMASLAAESLLAGAAIAATDVDTADGLVTWVLAAKAVVPAVWLGFSLAYSRADGRARALRWMPALLTSALLLLGVVFVFQGSVFALFPSADADSWRLEFGVAAMAFNCGALMTLVLALLNLEHTFRSSVGTMRWRVKYAVLAIVVILGSRLYVHSQGLLFSVPDMPALWGLEAIALLIGSAFLVLAYTRTGTGWADVTVYPSSAVVRSSLTVIVVGGYLLTVGVLAQLVRYLGGETFFLLQTTIVLLGLSGLAMLVLSDRARQRLHAFSARHFGKAQHDSVRIWTRLSQQLSAVSSPSALATASARMIAETFDVLSVNVWLMDDRGKFVLAATTNCQKDLSLAPTLDASAGFGSVDGPLDLETLDGAWADEFRDANPGQFPNGGHRWCVPLRSGAQVAGAVVLADRVSGVPYSGEDLDLLRCIGMQMTSVLLTLGLTDEVARARELEAFRTMSTFFVHDLKNAASSLNLMLRNLPVHFDDPAFRADALRGIGNAARRVEATIARLTALRDGADTARSEANLNDVVAEALDEVAAAPDITLTKSLEPVPSILADRDQLRSVVANLVTNAREAVGTGGRIEVSTSHRPGEVVLAVRDNGCGMSEAFMSSTLFRPFQTTKKSGLGIGLFQTRAIVQAHGGRIQVDSAEGRGTTFVATFPVVGER